MFAFFVEFCVCLVLLLYDVDLKKFSNIQGPTNPTRLRKKRSPID